MTGMSDTAIRAHCAELDRCNQRGGRMLSVFDLLEAGTLTLDLAAYLMARIGKGASFMVGAQPGGAGKTTVMCALLNLVPPDVTLTAATSAAVGAGLTGLANGRQCYICHEIGAGPYFAYLWGADLRTYCELSSKGHVLATNLHADDLDEACAQVCGDNRVPAAHFNAFELMVFLRVKDRYFDARRVVQLVYESNGASEHSLLYKAGAAPFEPRNTEAHQVAACRSFLERGLEEGIRTIEDARAHVLDFYAENL